MKAEIITIGDELLIGQTIDTNSAWLGSHLSDIGVQVVQITSISDTEKAIVDALRDAEKRADVILITGGLGPTKDDVTKHTLCKYFDCELVLNHEVLDQITSFFTSIGREMLESNTMQAYLPSCCEMMKNPRGTAAGMWFEKNGKYYLSMPGVPGEMKGIMKDSGLDKIRQLNGEIQILHRNILTVGIGESFIAHQAEVWENSLAKDKIKFAYLPSSMQVKIRLSTEGVDLEEMNQRIQKKIDEFTDIFHEIIYGYDDDSLESSIGKMLMSKGMTMSVAESITGGRIGNRLTSISGSSQYFKGSLVTYAEQSKIDVLGVLPETISAFSVVSEEVAIEMANGVKEKMDTDFGLSTTGYAELDPENQIPEAKVCIGLSGPDRNVAHTFVLGSGRRANIERASLFAINELRKEILAYNV